MFCSNCGFAMENDAKFCPNCFWKNTELADEIFVNSNENNNFVVEKNHSEKPEKPKKKHKKLITFLVIFFFVLGGLGAGAIFFIQSDFYKVKVAESYAIEGEYDKAMRQLHDTESDSAEILKKYIDVEYAKEDFLFSAESSRYSTAIKDLETFSKKVKNLKFSDMHLLTDELLEKANCYYEAVNYIERSFESDYGENTEMGQNLYNVQYVMLNEVVRNNSSEKGKKFTLEELQDYMDISQDADEYLKNIDFRYIEVSSRAVSEYCYLVKGENGKGQNKVQLGSKTTNTIETMLEYCREMFSAYEIYMDESLEKYDVEDELFMKDPKKGYESSVGSNLQKISDSEDMDKNAEIIIKMIKKDVLFYLITGKPAN